MHMFFSNKEERNPAINDNMDVCGGHYATWNNPDTEREKINTTGFHLYLESEEMKFIEIGEEHLLGVGWGVGKMLIKGCKYLCIRWIHFRDLRYI
jgi:hypothetical protein